MCYNNSLLRCKHALTPNKNSDRTLGIKGHRTLVYLFVTGQHFVTKMKLPRLDLGHPRFVLGLRKFYTSISFAYLGKQEQPRTKKISIFLQS